MYAILKRHILSLINNFNGFIKDKLAFAPSPHQYVVMKNTIILVHFDATVLIHVQVPAVLSTFVFVPRVQMSTQWKRQITFNIILNDGQTSRKMLIFFSSHGIAD